MTKKFFVGCYWEFGVKWRQNALVDNIIFLILIACLLDSVLKLWGEFLNLSLLESADCIVTVY